MKYIEPKIELLTPAQDAIMVSFEANTLDLWDMLIEG